MLMILDHHYWIGHLDCPDVSFVWTCYVQVDFAVRISVYAVSLARRSLERARMSQMAKDPPGSSSIYCKIVRVRAIKDVAFRVEFRQDSGSTRAAKVARLYVLFDAEPRGVFNVGYDCQTVGKLLLEFDMSFGKVTKRRERT
jgi:hypothetical protein